MSTDSRPTVPCGLCGAPTPMTGTKRCDWCWELEGRVRRHPEIARKILADLQRTSAPPAQPAQPPEREALAEIVDAWESLRGGRSYSPAAIEDWLVGPMAKTINKARRVLGRKTPGGRE